MKPMSSGVTPQNIRGISAAAAVLLRQNSKNRKWLYYETFKYPVSGFNCFVLFVFSP